MHALGCFLGSHLRAGDLLLLTGPLGAGKTTLTRGIGEGMGIEDTISSPTFILARTHTDSASGAPLVHIDAYRLKDSAELEDLGIDFAGSVVVCEWGDGLVDTGDRWLEIVISRIEDAVDLREVDWSEEFAEPREVELTAHGDGWEFLDELPGVIAGEH